MTPEEADEQVTAIFRSTHCKVCGMIWCGHPACSRWRYVRDMYDWYPERQAYRLKLEHRHLEPKDDT